MYSDPTPDEIREACERIRNNWSEVEEHRRRNPLFCETEMDSESSESDSLAEPRLNAGDFVS